MGGRGCVCPQSPSRQPAAPHTSGRPGHISRVPETRAGFLFDHRVGAAHPGVQTGLSGRTGAARPLPPAGPVGGPPTQQPSLPTPHPSEHGPLSCLQRTPQPESRPAGPARPGCTSAPPRLGGRRSVGAWEAPGGEHPLDPELQNAARRDQGCLPRGCPAPQGGEGAQGRGATCTREG